MAGVDARGATPRSEASCVAVGRLLPARSSHPTIFVTCEVGREGRHAPRPNDVGGQPRFPAPRKGVILPLLVISGLANGPPAGGGDGLRFLSTRDTLLVCAGRFDCGNSAFSQQKSAFHGSIRSGHGTRLGAAATAAHDGSPSVESVFLNRSRHFTVHLFRPWRPVCGAAATAAPDGSPRSYPCRRLQRPVASEDEASAPRRRSQLSPGNARH